MKKTIQGSRYDTSKGSVVASATFLDEGDPFWFRESLYQRPLGSWYVVGSGGSMSRWAKRNGDATRADGTGLHALSDSEAYEWMLRFGRYDLITEHFGD